MLIGQKFGLDPALMTDILNSSSSMNNSTRNKFKQHVLSRDFDTGGFTLLLVAKGVGIAMKVARAPRRPRRQLPRDVGDHIQGVGPSVDHTAIARMCESFAGVELTSDSVPRKRSTAD